jgi:hypothetical protein
VVILKWKESLEAELKTLKVRITTGESHVASLKTEDY